MMSENDDIITHISNGSYGQITIIDENTIVKNTKKFNSNNFYYKQNIQEAVFLSTVKHENIVNTKNIYLTNDEIKIEQERGECTLHDYINKFNRKTRMMNFKYIFFQLVKILFFLHKNGYIHGDLKPNNILISTKDMTIKLIDFGGICSFRLNNQHKPICTPSFCPPEGWKQLNINCLNSKFDVWSLAMTLYFYITRSYLLDFKDDKTIYYVNEFKWSFNKFYHHNIDKIKNVVDEDIFILLQKMLMYDPDDRVSSDELYFDEYFSNFKKEYISNFKYESQFDIHFMENYTTSEWKQRANLIEWLFEYCKLNDILDHCVLTIWIIDSYLNKKKIKITSKNKILYGYSSILICSILIANKNLEESLLNQLPKYISKKKLFNVIDDIMNNLNFKLYVPTFDFILKSKKIQLKYEIIKNILLEKKYIGLDQKLLCDIYLHLEKK